MKLFSGKFQLAVFRLFIMIIFIAIGASIFIFHNQITMFMNEMKAFYYISKGDDFYKNKDFQKAIYNYNYALQLYPEHSKAQYNLGNIYVVYEDFYSAVTCYEKALSIRPDYINARISLALVLIQELHDIDRSIDEYINAANSRIAKFNIPFISQDKKVLNSSKAIAYYDLGLAYKAKSMLYDYNTDSAKECLLNAVDSYKKSLEINPANPDAHYNLALALQLLGNTIESTQEYCKAIQIAPLNYDAHYNLAILLKQTGRYKDSLIELQNAGILISGAGSLEKNEYLLQMLNDVNQKFSAQKSEQNFQKKDISDNNDTTVENNLKDTDKTSTIQPCEICRELLSN